jgi:ribosomal-protein-alanine N-acetyltransferase
VIVRPAREQDRAAIAAIQCESPEASPWDPDGFDVTVAEIDGEVAGFLVARQVAPDESEILNLAVSPRLRRRGAARSLLRNLLKTTKGDIFLEVRESNTAARRLYDSMGFTVIGSRPMYYSDPLEAGIVMNFHSC